MKNFAFAAVALLALAACGDGETVMTGETREEVTETSVEEVVAAPTEEATPAPVEDVTPEAPTSGFSADVTIEELKATGSFLNSCSSSSVEGGVLTANCRRINGTYIKSTLDLKTCTSGVENIDGTLQCTP